MKKKNPNVCVCIKALNRDLKNIRYKRKWQTKITFKNSSKTF